MNFCYNEKNMYEYQMVDMEGHMEYRKSVLIILAKDAKEECDWRVFENTYDVNIVKGKIVLNSINILMKRGIKGLYIYALKMDK